MNNDQEQDRGEFAPAPTVFNDLASLKYKQTVGPIESAMREQRIQDGDLMNVMRQEVIDMEAFLGSGKPVVPSPAGDIRALKHRIHELEGELLGYKKIVADQDAMLERQTARIVDLQAHIENLDGEDR